VRRLHVHLNGEAIRSCITPISEAEGKKLTTIEPRPMAPTASVLPCMPHGFKHDVAQCGYCQSGQIMSAIAFLQIAPRGKPPTTAEIDSAMDGNICRCGTYARIRVCCRRRRPHPRLKDPPCCRTSTTAICRVRHSA